MPNNTGISVGVGAAFLTLGVALLASARWAAVLLCGIGACWIVWTFAVKLVADFKTERFHEEIGLAME